MNTPAAAADGPSLSTTATSGSPLAFRPAVTPAARKPRGAVTPAPPGAVTPAPPGAVTPAPPGAVTPAPAGPAGAAAPWL